MCDGGVEESIGEYADFAPKNISKYDLANVQRRAEIVGARLNFFEFMNADGSGYSSEKPVILRTAWTALEDLDQAYLVFELRRDTAINIGAITSTNLGPVGKGKNYVTTIELDVSLLAQGKYDLIPYIGYFPKDNVISTFQGYDAPNVNLHFEVNQSEFGELYGTGFGGSILLKPIKSIQQNAD